jgi:hypothetical protein
MAQFRHPTGHGPAVIMRWIFVETASRSRTFTIFEGTSAQELELPLDPRCPPNMSGLRSATCGGRPKAKVSGLWTLVVSARIQHGLSERNDERRT